MSRYPKGVSTPMIFPSGLIILSRPNFVTIFLNVHCASSSFFSRIMTFKSFLKPALEENLFLVHRKSAWKFETQKNTNSKKHRGYIQEQLIITWKKLVQNSAQEVKTCWQVSWETLTLTHWNNTIVVFKTQCRKPREYQKWKMLCSVDVGLLYLTWHRPVKV